MKFSLTTKECSIDLGLVLISISQNPHCSVLWLIFVEIFLPRKMVPLIFGTQKSRLILFLIGNSKIILPLAVIVWALILGLILLIRFIDPFQNLSLIFSTSQFVFGFSVFSFRFLAYLIWIDDTGLQKHPLHFISQPVLTSDCLFAHLLTIVLLHLILSKFGIQTLVLTAYKLPELIDVVHKLLI